MKNLRLKLKICLLTVALSCVGGGYRLLAQTFDANSKITSMTSDLKTIGKNVISLVSVLVGVVGAIMLVWNYFRRAKGEGQGNDALGSWGWGLLFTFIFLQLISKVLL